MKRAKVLPRPYTNDMTAALTKHAAQAKLKPLNPLAMITLAAELRKLADETEQIAVREALESTDWRVRTAAAVIGWQPSKLVQALGLDGRPNARWAKLGQLVRRRQQARSRRTVE